MTTYEWNAGCRFLESAPEGASVYDDTGRSAEVANMMGGRYLLMQDGDPVGQTDEEWRAMEFIMSGKLLLERKR